MRVSLEVFGDKQFDRELRLVGRRAVEAKPVFEAVGWYLAHVQREQFASQGARSGGWQPLAPSTVARKGSDTILVDSGALRDSFQYGAEANIFEVTDDYLRYGSDVEYGEFHQFGTSDIPMRKVFELSDDDRTKIVKSLQRWVIEGDVINLEVGTV
jgi:phage gpG-like protein